MLDNELETWNFNREFFNVLIEKYTFMDDFKIKIIVGSRMVVFDATETDLEELKKFLSTVHERTKMIE